VWKSTAGPRLHSGGRGISVASTATPYDPYFKSMPPPSLPSSSSSWPSCCHQLALVKLLLSFSFPLFKSKLANMTKQVVQTSSLLTTTTITKRWSCGWQCWYIVQQQHCQGNFATDIIGSSSSLPALNVACVPYQSYQYFGWWEKILHFNFPVPGTREKLGLVFMTPYLIYLATLKAVCQQVCQENPK